MNGRVVVARSILLVTFLFALAPLVRRGDLSIPQHHLFHALMLAVAAFAGILLGTRPASSRSTRGGALWLVLAMLSPIIAMLLMWPSEYSVFERAIFFHVLDHLGLVGLGLLTGYAGERYAAGIGWATGLSLSVMAISAMWGYGVSHAPAAIAERSSAQPAAVSRPADPSRGAALFTMNCAVCHGAGGVGGAGPSLKNEHSRKSFAQAVTWIEHPSAPMPALYPAVLTAQNVADLAAYVENLK